MKIILLLALVICSAACGVEDVGYDNDSYIDDSGNNNGNDNSQDNDQDNDISEDNDQDNDVETSNDGDVTNERSERRSKGRFSRFAAQRH